MDMRVRTYTFYGNVTIGKKVNLVKTIWVPFAQLLFLPFKKKLCNY